jgi:hypothetical protein
VGAVVLTEQDATGEFLRVVLVQAVQQGHVQVTLPRKLTVHKGTQLRRGEGDIDREREREGPRASGRERERGKGRRWRKTKQDIMSFLIACTGMKKYFYTYKVVKRQ